MQHSWKNWPEGTFCKTWGTILWRKESEPRHESFVGVDMVEFALLDDPFLGSNCGLRGWEKFCHGDVQITTSFLKKHSAKSTVWYIGSIRFGAMWGVWKLLGLDYQYSLPFRTMRSNQDWPWLNLSHVRLVDWELRQKLDSLLWQHISCSGCKPKKLRFCGYGDMDIPCLTKLKPDARCGITSWDIWK